MQHQNQKVLLKIFILRYLYNTNNGINSDNDNVAIIKNSNSYATMRSHIKTDEISF